MLLVISVIVALAILAVLLNIIGGITGIGQGDPTSLMHAALTKEVAAGYGCSATQTTTIARGTSVFAKSIQGDIASIQPSDNLYFIVDPGTVGLTASSGSFNPSAGQATLLANSHSQQVQQITFVVCADTQSYPQQFNICIGSSPNSQVVATCAPDEAFYNPTSPYNPPSTSTTTTSTTNPPGASSTTTTTLSTTTTEPSSSTTTTLSQPDLVPSLDSAAYVAIQYWGPAAATLKTTNYGGVLAGPSYTSIVANSTGASIMPALAGVPFLSPLASFTSPLSLSCSQTGIYSINATANSGNLVVNDSGTNGVAQSSLACLAWWCPFLPFISSCIPPSPPRPPAKTSFNVVTDFGADNTGTKDDYDTLLKAAEAVSSVPGASLYFPAGTYYIGKYKQDQVSNQNGYSNPGNNITNIIYGNCSGLRIYGDGPGKTIISVEGNFTRTADYSIAGEWYSVNNSVDPFEFSNCTDFTLSGMEIYGQADKMLRPNPSVTAGDDYGVYTLGSSNYVIQDVYVHNFATGGMMLGGGLFLGEPDGSDSLYEADTNASVLDSTSSNNGRTAIDVDQLNGGYFYNDAFQDTGDTQGNYGGHAPEAGVDIDPDLLDTTPSPQYIDQTTGNLVFNYTTFFNNYGPQFLSTPAVSTSSGDVAATQNYLITNSNITASYPTGDDVLAISVDERNLVVSNSYIDASINAIQPVSGAIGASATLENDTITSTGQGIFVDETNSADPDALLIENDVFYSQYDPARGNPLTLVGSGIDIAESSFYVGGFTGGCGAQCNSSAVQINASSSTNSVILPATPFNHTLGSYDVHDVTGYPGVADASAMGISMTASDFTGGTFDKELAANGFWEMDGEPLQLINQACAANKQESQNCVITPTEEQSILSTLSNYFNEPAVQEAPNIVGYYVQDDYQGNMTGVLQAIHDLVAQANAGLASPKRVTVCGLGDNLDYQDPSTGLWYNTTAYLLKALTNYSPKWCDAVMIYSYGYNPYSSDPSTVDWTMNASLPLVKSELLKLGWDPSTQPLIGAPQTFYYSPGTPLVPNYVNPTSQTIATQISAFCQGGVSMIYPYAWADVDSGIAGTQEMFNAPFMRQGVAQGLADCRKYWGSS